MLNCLILALPVQAVALGPLPGSQHVGQAIDILTATRYGFSRSAGNIFKLVFNCSTNAFAPDEYSYPWGVQQPAPLPECQRMVRTLSVQTSEQYQHESTEDIAIGGKFKSFAGKYAVSSKEVRSHLSNRKETVSESWTRCVKYELTILPGYAEFDPFFVTSVKALPEKFSAENADVFFNFFDQWNTHVVTRCFVGGAMAERAYTEEAYTKDHSMEELKREASASFLIGIDSTSSSSTTVDKEFKQDTTFTGMETFGGTPSSDNQWVEFMKSVMGFRNPVCLDFKAVDLAELMMPPWTSHAELHLRAAAVRQAMVHYFYRPGCTNPLFPNYDERALQDDGSCSPKVRSLRIRAYVDLDDMLSVEGIGKQLVWKHLRGVDVGEQDKHHFPVTLTYTLADGKKHVEDWFAQSERVHTSPYPLNYCHPPNFTKIEGRDTMKVSAVDSDGTVEVYFHDDPKGAVWYEGIISWAPEDECAQGREVPTTEVFA